VLTSLCVLSLALPASAFAQSTSQKPPQVTKPAPKPAIGFKAMAAVQLTAMDSSQTFEALVGSANLPGFGGTADVLNIFSRVFVRVGMAQDFKDGSRVLVLDDGSIHDTGVPLTLKVQTVEVAAGWRQSPRRHPKFAWYVGGGVAFAKLMSESPAPQPGDNDSDSGSGALVLAGFDRVLWTTLIGGLEVQYRMVDDVIGTGGVSKAFGETSLSGATIRGMIGFKFGK
jgi:hypothetical protein